MTKVRLAKALGTLLLLFAAAYGPAFLTVVLLKLRPFEAVPVIIVISLAAAILLIGVARAVSDQQLSREILKTVAQLLKNPLREATSATSER